MTIRRNIDSFANLPVVDFDPEHVTRLDADHAWRLRTSDFDVHVDPLLARFLDTPGASDVRALALGFWGGSFPPPVAELVAAADRLPSLRALFVGDIADQELHMSWIVHGDVTPLLRAYPGLEEFRIRGSARLRLEPVRHEALRVLTFESGGLPGGVVRAVAASDLPALEHLELWLGVPDYGGDATVEDLAPILAGTRLPPITYLGLRNAVIVDDVARALADAPVVAGLHTLDLSLGILTDDGAAVLLAGQPLTHLKTLDLHHHYLSEQMAARCVAELPTVAVDVSDRREEEREEYEEDEDDDEEYEVEVYRYVAVSE